MKHLPAQWIAPREWKIPTIGTTPKYVTAFSAVRVRDITAVLEQFFCIPKCRSGKKLV
jgi:hypothetical protein